MGVPSIRGLKYNFTVPTHLHHASTPTLRLEYFGKPTPTALRWGRRYLYWLSQMGRTQCTALEITGPSTSVQRLMFIPRVANNRSRIALQSMPEVEGLYQKV